MSSAKDDVDRMRLSWSLGLGCLSAKEMKDMEIQEGLGRFREKERG